MSLFDFLNSLIGGKTKPTSPTPAPFGSGKPQPLPDSPDEPAQITNPKILLLIYNPTVDATTGKKLCEVMNWQRPDAIVGQFISDVLQASGGLVRYQITQRLELDEFPILADGFQYTSQTYLDVVRAGKPAHNPTGINYNAILKKFNILQRIGNNEFDEVWSWVFPMRAYMSR